MTLQNMFFYMLCDFHLMWMMPISSATCWSCFCCRTYAVWYFNYKLLSTSNCLDLQLLLVGYFSRPNKNRWPRCIWKTMNFCVELRSTCVCGASATEYGCQSFVCWSGLHKFYLLEWTAGNHFHSVLFFFRWLFCIYFGWRRILLIKIALHVIWFWTFYFRIGW